MTKDEIQQALRLTAMGRCGHPLQEQLAEKLAEVFAHGCPHESIADFEAERDASSLEARLQQLEATTPKRTRAKKAD